MKSKLYLITAVLLVAIVVIMSACASPPPAPLAIVDAAGARDAALAYLRKADPANAPAARTRWQEQDTTPTEIVGRAEKRFTSKEWVVTVACPVVPLDVTVYQVVVSSTSLGWHWKGRVDAKGSVTEISAFKLMSEEGGRKVAEEFVRHSPTFVFDGIEGTLKLGETLKLRCPACWAFVFEFDSRHAGYGDRTGLVLAQVITHHRAVITVEQLEVTSAIMDDTWDMMRQKTVGEPEKQTR